MSDDSRASRRSLFDIFRPKTPGEQSFSIRQFYAQRAASGQATSPELPEFRLRDGLHVVRTTNVGSGNVSPEAAHAETASLLREKS